MKEDKKTAAESTSFRSGEQLSLDMGQPLSINYTATPGSIASFLLTGRENALTAKDLCRITGRPFREVTKRIQEERLQGAPILSSSDRGYWLAEDAEEIIRCTEALHRRAKTIHRTAAALKRIVKV